MQKKFTLSFVAATLVAGLQAQEITLEPLHVTSTAIKTDELRSTDAVEVYTQEDIEKAHAQNVYEFLQKQTSVFATSAYGNPFMQKLDMRGFGIGDGYQNIVVTINGRKMNNVDMVAPLLASISPSSIKKIEIIKSSGIVVGGDGANAGVINIITKKTNDKEIGFYIGNYGLADGSVYFGHKDEKFAISFSGETQKSDGIREINNNGNKDANKFSTGNVNLAYTPLESLELRLGAAATSTNVTYVGTMTKQEYDANPKQRGTVDYGWGPQPSSVTEQSYSSQVLNGGITYDINEALSFNIDASKEQKKSNYITYNSVTNYDYKQGSSSLDYLGDIASLKMGIDLFKGTATRPSLEITKKNQASYAISEFYLQDLTFKAGYRYETVRFTKAGGEDKKDHLHGVELGVNYLLSKQNSLFAHYSHSFESASIDRLFSFFTGNYTGYVKPAIADDFSLGYNNIQTNNKLKISAFYIKLKDEIYYYADPAFVNSKNTNIDKSHKYGLDFYDNYILNQQFNVALNYNYVKAIIDEELQNGENYAGKELPGVPNHNIKATLNYLPNPFTTVALTQVYRSSSYAANDFNNNFTQKQEAYNTTDISIAYAKDNYEVFAKINNLFNQKNGIWIKDDAIYPVNYTTTGFVGFKLKY